MRLCRFTSVFVHSDVVLLCWHGCSMADCRCCIFCLHSPLLVFFEVVGGWQHGQPHPSLFVVLFKVVTVQSVKTIQYITTHLCVLCLCHRRHVCSRVEDYWEGYKLFCYAYYSHSPQHESTFKQSKLGSWFCTFFHSLSFISWFHHRALCRPCQCIVCFGMIGHI